MDDRQIEYKSLRKELMAHQSRRESVLAVGITVAVTIIVAGIEFGNPYIPLFSLLILLIVRVQIIHIHAGIYRIATFLRIVHEEDNPELNWETASYEIRRHDQENEPSAIKKALSWNVPIFSPMEHIIFFTGSAGVATAIFLSFSQPNAIPIVVIAIVLWLILWAIYGHKDKRSLAAVEDKDAEFFRERWSSRQLDEEV